MREGFTIACESPPVVRGAGLAFLWRSRAPRLFARGRLPLGALGRSSAPGMRLHCSRIFAKPGFASSYDPMRIVFPLRPTMSCATMKLL